jgi:apolipoprotein N-acyltransferase
MEHFDRQDSMKSTSSEAIRADVKLVVFPEGSNRSWTDAEASYWREISARARASMASVLLGVTDDLTTFHAQDDYINALYDVASGRLYHAMIPMPIGVWHPWQPLGHVPMRAAFDPIRLERGQAVYTICYEDTILLPALLRYLSATKPVAFVSAANQWFAKDWLSEPQANSVAMTARWMGLPLVRAVAR